MQVHAMYFSAEHSLSDAWTAILRQAEFVYRNKILISFTLLHQIFVLSTCDKWLTCAMLR
jgi:hypothetical protein